MVTTVRILLPDAVAVCSGAYHNAVLSCFLWLGLQLLYPFPGLVAHLTLENIIIRCYGTFPATGFVTGGAQCT